MYDTPGPFSLESTKQEIYRPMKTGKKKEEPKTVEQQITDLLNDVLTAYQADIEELVDKYVSESKKRQVKNQIQRKVVAWKNQLADLLTKPRVPILDKTLEDLSAIPEEAKIAGKYKVEITMDGPDVQKVALLDQNGVEMALFTPDKTGIESSGSGPKQSVISTEKIELQIEVKAVGEVLKDRVADMEAILDRKAAEVVEDDSGATIYFEYDTLNEAYISKLVVDGIAPELEYEVSATVHDPLESRFSQEEIDRIDATPRSLVLYTSQNSNPVTYCTRCVEIGHVPPGAKRSAGTPGKDCSFCGWTL